MKIKLTVMLTLQPDFMRAFEHLCAEKSVPKKDVWWLVRTSNRIEAAKAVFYKRRQKVTIELGVPNPENPQMLRIPEEKTGEWQTRIEKLLVDMEAVETFIDEESPIVLADPLPENSALLAEDITYLQSCGLIFNPDKVKEENEESSQDSPKIIAATGRAVGH